MTSHRVVLTKAAGKRGGAVGDPIPEGSRTSEQTPKDAVAQQRFVMFVFPSKAVKDLPTTLGNFCRKPITEPTKVSKWVAGHSDPAGSLMSAAEQLQACVPGVQAVKTFNTPGAPNIVNPGLVGGTTTIVLAAADASVKAWIARLVAELGLEPLDIRALVAASCLEGTLRLSFGCLLYSKELFCEFNLRPILK